MMGALQPWHLLVLGFCCVVVVAVVVLIVVLVTRGNRRS